MARQNIYIIVATFNDKHILRFVVCSRMTESKDVQFAWEEIRGQADQVLMGNDTDSGILVHDRKTYIRMNYNAIRNDCPSNGVKINGITNGQAWRKGGVNFYTQLKASVKSSFDDDTGYILRAQ